MERREEGGVDGEGLGDLLSSNGDHGRCQGCGERRPRAAPWGALKECLRRWEGVEWCCGGEEGAGGAFI
jgi:hypothetical protein